MTEKENKRAPRLTPSGFTKEEELLLNDFSRNVSTKSSALFYGNAFIVSAVPICKFIKIHVHFCPFSSFTFRPQGFSGEFI